jgi:hypothetical protein
VCQCGPTQRRQPPNLCCAGLHIILTGQWYIEIPMTSSELCYLMLSNSFHIRNKDVGSIDKRKVMHRLVTSWTRKLHQGHPLQKTWQNSHKYVYVRDYGRFQVIMAATQTSSRACRHQVVTYIATSSLESYYWHICFKAIINEEWKKYPLLGNGCVTCTNRKTVGRGVFCGVRADAIQRRLAAN